MKASWQWKEEGELSRKFSDRAEVAAYDERHGRFRDIEGEVAAALAGLGAGPGQVVADFACGTGAFALRAARVCRRVLAIDLSAEMLDYVAWRAREAGLDNIVCLRGGFLTYVHEEAPVDAVHTSLGLHHLPDFWKLVGLHRLAAILKPGGRLYLRDVVFSFDAARSEPAIERFVGRMSLHMGPDGRTAAETHVREEYSTWSWVMEGLLEKAGFQIDAAEYTDDFLAAYVCTKNAAPMSVRSLTAAGRQLP